MQISEKPAVYANPRVSAPSDLRNSAPPDICAA